MSTRERIIEAAARLFSRKPYSKVSVEEVAREAGVSKGAVFHYFKSKLELAEQALASFLERLVAAPLRAILASRAPFEEKVGRMLSLAIGVTLRSDVKALLFLTSVYEELGAGVGGSSLGGSTRSTLGFSPSS